MLAADDALRAYVLLLHLKTARDGFPERYRKGDRPLTPNVRGIASALDKLKSKADERARRSLVKMQDIDARLDPAFDKLDAKLVETNAEVSNIEQMVVEIEQSNGGPT